MYGTTSEVRWRGAAKFTSIVSTSGNGGPGRPAALKRQSIRPPIVSIGGRDGVGIAQVDDLVAGDVDRRVLEVEDVDLGAELGEPLDRGRAHPGSAATAHDHPLAFVAERRCHHVPL